MVPRSSINASLGSVKLYGIGELNFIVNHDSLLECDFRLRLEPALCEISHVTDVVVVGWTYSLFSLQTTALIDVLI